MSLQRVIQRINTSASLKNMSYEFSEIIFGEEESIEFYHYFQNWTGTIHSIG